MKLILLSIKRRAHCWLNCSANRNSICLALERTINSFSDCSWFRSNGSITLTARQWQVMANIQPLWNKLNSKLSAFIPASVQGCKLLTLAHYINDIHITTKLKVNLDNNTTKHKMQTLQRFVCASQCDTCRHPESIVTFLPARIAQTPSRGRRRNKAFPLSKKTFRRPVLPRCQWYGNDYAFEWVHLSLEWSCFSSWKQS